MQDIPYSSHNDEVLLCASACGRTVVFIGQMERQAYFRLLTPSLDTPLLASSASARI